MPEPKRSWIIRPYREGEQVDIVNLCKLIFAEQPADRFSLEYWNWEFTANSSGPAKIWIADDNGKVVGHYAVVPRLVQIGNEVRLGSIVVDVMTHPDYRMQGMFAAIGREALVGAANSGIEFCYGFPVRSDVMPGHLKVGWQEIFDIPVWVRPIRFEPLVRHYIDLPIISPLLARGAQVAYRLGVMPILRSVYRGTGLPSDVTIHEIKDFDERFDVLWEAACKQFSIMGVRDSKYLNWRYRKHPDYSYRVWVAEQEGRLLGYLVTRTGELLELKSGIIVDMLVHPDFMGCTDLLLQHVVNEFGQAREMDLLACMMTRQGFYATALRRHGFISAPQVFWFIIHINREDAPRDQLLEPANWYLSWGDTDVI